MTFRKTSTRRFMCSFGVNSESAAFAVAIGSFMQAGCATTAQPIFNRPNPPISWPGPNRTPRIDYVGSISTSADLKAARSTFDVLGDIFAGREEPKQMVGPRAVVVTGDAERVWIADPGDHCLHLFDLTGRKYARIETVGENRLMSPVGLCLGPRETIFVCDSQETGIYQLSDRTGALLRRVRLPSDIQRPVDIFFDGTTNELFVIDVSAHNVKVLGVGGELVRILGERGEEAGEFNFPSAITVDDKAIWIADTGNHRVQALERSGSPVAAFGKAGDAPGDLAMPKGIATDPDGNVYVVDGRFENVQVFDAKGLLLSHFGEEGRGAGEFWLPGGIFVERSGRIWVTDTYNKRVQVFQYVRGGGDEN